MPVVATSWDSYDLPDNTGPQLYGGCVLPGSKASAFAGTTSEGGKRFGGQRQRGGGFWIGGEPNESSENDSTAQTANKPGAAPAKSITKYSPGDHTAGRRRS